MLSSPEGKSSKFKGQYLGFTWSQSGAGRSSIYRILMGKNRNHDGKMLEMMIDRWIFMGMCMYVRYPMSKQRQVVISGWLAICM